MGQPEIIYKGLTFRLDKFYYNRGSHGGRFTPPEPPELEIEKMSVADSIIWDEKKEDYVPMTWIRVPDILLEIFTDNSDFINLCLAAINTEIADEVLERRILEAENE